MYEVCDFGFPVYCDTSVTFITVLPVNDAPVPTSDFSSLAEDDTLSGNSLLLNDSDIDGDSLTQSTSLLNGPFHGVATPAIDGTYTYVPTPNFHGSDYFVYTVCDNGIPQRCAQDTAFITINSVNDSPIAQDNIIVTALNTSITVNVQGRIGYNYS